MSLKAILKDKGISQAKLAEDLGIQLHEVSALLNAKKKLDEETALKISEILNVSLEEFYTEDEESSDKTLNEEKKEEVKKPVASDSIFLVKNIYANPVHVLHYLIAPNDVLNLTKDEFQSTKVQRCIALKLLAKA